MCLKYASCYILTQKSNRLKLGFFVPFSVLMMILFGVQLTLAAVCIVVAWWPLTVYFVLTLFGLWGLCCLFVIKRLLCISRKLIMCHAFMFWSVRIIKNIWTLLGTRVIRKVRRSIQLGKRYSHRILPRFNIFLCNWNALGPGFLRSSNFIVEKNNFALPANNLPSRGAFSKFVV